jgi:organic radical activating enzyme
MTIAYVEITAACNFRCSFCPLISMERPMLTMPSDMVLDLIEQIRHGGLADTISFHVMGEPTLHKDLVRFCRVATEGGLDVSLVTNGSRLSDAMNKALLDTGLSKISISLRSPNDEYYSETFKASKQLDYEDYLQQIHALIAESCKRGPEHPTSIGIRVFRRYLSDSLRNEVRHQETLYDTESMIRRLQDWGEELCGLTTADLRRMYPERFAAEFRIPLTHRASLRTNPIMRWWQREADSVDTKYPAVISYCSGFNDQFAVLADGRVTACCLDYEGNTALGNVKERSLKEILGGSPVADFVRSFNRLRPPTKTCAKCLGGNTLPEWIGRQTLAVGSHARTQGLSALQAMSKSKSARRKLPNGA